MHRRKNSGLATAIGMILGGVAAIPVALFLAWKISGNDPLGIFGTADEASVKVVASAIVNGTSSQMPNWLLRPNPKTTHKRNLPQVEIDLREFLK